MKKVFIYKVFLILVLFLFVFSYFKAFGAGAYSVLSFLVFDSITILTLLNYAAVIIISAILIQAYKFIFINKIFVKESDSKDSESKKIIKKNIKKKINVISENNFNDVIFDICFLLTASVIGITVNVKESLIIKESVLIFFAAYILLKYFYSKIFLTFNITTSLFFIYTVYLFVLSVFSLFPHYSYRFALNYLALYLIILFVSSNINSDNQIKKIMDYVYFSGIIFIFVYCVQYTDFWNFENKYDCFTLGNKNYFIDYLTIIAALSMYKIIVNFHNKTFRVLNIFALGVIIYIFYFINSYFGFISLTILFIVFLVKIILKIKSIKFAAILIFVIAAACIVVFIYVPNSKLNIRKTNFFESSSFKIRSNIWISTANMIKSNFIKGFGPGLYSVFIPDFLTDDYKKNWGNTTEMLLHSHNEILETTAETGFLGALLILIPFVFFIIALMKKKLLTDDKTFWLAVILTILILHSLVEVTSRYTSTQIFTALLIGLLLTDRKETSSERVSSKIEFSNFFKILVCCAFVILFIDNLKLVRTQFLNETMNMSNITESAKLYDKDPDVFYRKAYLEFMSEEYGKSIQSYKKCLELHKNFADTRKNLSLAYYKINDIDAALKTIDEELLINPYNERAQKIKLLLQPKTEFEH